MPTPTMKSGLQKLNKLIREHKAETAAGIVGIVVINLILFAKTYHGSAIDAQKAGEFGDFVGGYFGPIFSLVGIVLLIKTIKTERSASRVEAFENKYFELLKMHRDNVAEITLGKAAGRKVFVLVLREWREALQIVRRVAQQAGQTLTQEQLLQITYCCLFYGTGPNSSRMLSLSLSQFDHTFVDRIDYELERSKESVASSRNFKFVPFEGHQSRLGHYYRHLYQLVRYVDGQTLDIDKYEYVKTIRAQLSTHEQALLLLNSISPMGQEWWSKHLIDKYRIVQNIPKGFFLDHMELPLSALFSAGYFEHEKTATYNFPSLGKPFVRV